MTKNQFNKIPWIKTPFIRSAGLSRAAGCNIYLKLENLQPSGSFKSRGIGSFILDHVTESTKSNNHTDIENSKPHFYTSSGGNAGLGCVYAALTLDCSATVVVPFSTSDAMISKLKTAGATEVIQHGASWVEADNHLRNLIPVRRKEGQNAVYVPPFDAPGVWKGHATMVAEIVEQLKEVDRYYSTTASPTGELGVKWDVLVCSVGGGGLFSGLMQGLEETRSLNVKILAVETEGADSLSQAVRAGELVTLPSITSIATSLGARTVCQRALDYGMRDNVTTVVLSDAEAVEGCKKFLDDERTLVEPACGVCLSLCYEGRLRRLMPELTAESNVVIVVCGGSNISFEILDSYMKKYDV